MKNELLLSAAILPMCGMAGEAIAHLRQRERRKKSNVRT